jgi:tryptophan halogenase
MIKRIVVVGGGFAGWYTAACLQYKCPGLAITLIESPNVPRLRVGETLGFGASGLFAENFGLTNERELMRQTGSIYKLGVHTEKFFSDTESIAHGHSRNISVSDVMHTDNPRNLTFGGDIPHWTDKKPSKFNGIYESWISLNPHASESRAEKFVNEIYDCTHFCLNPIVPFDENNEMIMRSSHSYHFDAEEMVSLVKNTALKRNTNARFQHIVGNVTDVDIDPNGSISGLLVGDQQRITGDLYIDCSGLSRVLAKRTHQKYWIDLEGFNNSAWVCPTKYEDPEKEMICSTKLIGEDYGWRFLINLYHRQGNGYVFNDNFVDSKIIGDNLDQLTKHRQLVAPRLIKWNPGMYERPWVNNCLVLGVASNFFDPWDAPVFSEHNFDIKDLIEVVNSEAQGLFLQTLITNFNDRSVHRSQERQIRVLIAHGLSKRSGAYWDHVRNFANQTKVFEKFENLLTTCPGFNIYAKTMVLTNIDISKWNLPQLTEHDLQRAQQYFDLQKSRNEQIRAKSWPNSYQWLKSNLFGGATSQEIYEEFNHRQTC